MISHTWYRGIPGFYGKVLRYTYRYDHLSFVKDLQFHVAIVKLKIFFDQYSWPSPGKPRVTSKVRKWSPWENMSIIKTKIRMVTKISREVFRKPDRILESRDRD